MLQLIPLRDSDGNSAVEYAVMVAVIVGGLVIGAEGINLAINSHADKLASHMQGQTDANERDASRVAAATVASDKSDTASSSGGFLLAMAACGAAILSPVALMFLMKQRRKTEKALPDGAGDLECAKSHPAGFVIKRQELHRILSRNLQNLLESHIAVRHIMSLRPLSVLPTAALPELAEMMNRRQFRHLLVCDSKERLVGVVSDRDVAAGKGKTAADIMTSKPFTISAEADIRTAMTLMLDRHISSLPVVDEEQLIGILTTTDLVLMLQCTMQLLERMRSEGFDSALTAAAQ